MHRLLTTVLLSTLVLAGAGCSSTPAASPTAGRAADDTATCVYRPDPPAARPVDLPPTSGVPATGTASATLTLGGHPVTITLNREAAPCTANSFASLVKRGFFDGTQCHRLATRGLKMLQCGDPTASGRGGPGYEFDDELAGTQGYPAGTVAMANAGPNTNGSQFFLVFGDSQLPPNYTVFGQMDAASVEGLTQLSAKGHDDSYGDGTGRPSADATITKVALG